MRRTLVAAVAVVALAVAGWYQVNLPVGHVPAGAFRVACGVAPSVVHPRDVC